MTSGTDHADDSFLIEFERESPLQRNHACLQCKARKRKCDGVRDTTWGGIDENDVQLRPVCAPCQRAFSRHSSARSAGRPFPDDTWSQAGPLCGWVDIAECTGTQSATTQTPEAHTNLGQTVPLNSVPTLPATTALPTPSLPEILAEMLSASFTSQSNQGTDASQMMPLYWPKNLPTPYLLEHLMDTFFRYTPRLPRIINRAKLVARVRLGPTHSAFPHPALLHAICAIAAQHTGWVTSLPTESLGPAMANVFASGADLESIADFALAQAEASRRSIHQTAHIAPALGTDSVFDILQAEMIAADVWLQRGLYGGGLACLGQAVRTVKTLELTNREFVYKRDAALILPPFTGLEREERLAAAWHALVLESFVAISRYWPSCVDDRDMFCKLPANAEFFQSSPDRLEPNSQSGQDPLLYVHHPSADAFVLNCKVALLCSRAARFIREWSQRVPVPGDDLSGMDSPTFKSIIQDVTDFQRTMPSSVKNVFRLLQDPSAGFLNADFLGLHIMPHMVILMLHDVFVIDSRPHEGGLPHMHKPLEAVLGILHLIPSNLDVSQIMTADLAFNIHVCGRILADFVGHALGRQAYGIAVRYKADFAAILNLLDRYGIKHALGRFSVAILNQYMSDKATRSGTTDPSAGATSFDGALTEITAEIHQTPAESIPPNGHGGGMPAFDFLSSNVLSNESPEHWNGSAGSWLDPSSQASSCYSTFVTDRPVGFSYTQLAPDWSSGIQPES